MKLLKPLNPKSESGMSLIEVLIAMGIFLIGGVLVAQLFPGGFTSIQRTQNTTIATSLAEMELDRWKGRAENLPAGILGLDPDTGEVLTDLDPEDMSELDGKGRYYSDVNKFRHVYGESTIIPAPTSDDWATDDTSSVYVLGFSPIKYVDTNSVVVYSGALRRVDVPENTAYASFRLSDYAIDYEKGLVYVANASYARQFVISYSYWESDGSGAPTLVSVVSKTITFNPDENVDGNCQVKPIPLDDTTSVADATGFGGVEIASDSLHRKFTNLTDTASWAWSTTDPYQFVVKDSIAGVLAFNPYGYGKTEITARGRQKLTAYIDYDVYDWHIIREQKIIPSQAISDTDPYCRVRLALRYVKRSYSSTDEDGDSYTGLLPLDSAAPTGWTYFDVLAIDSRTGIKYNEKTKFTTSAGDTQYVFTVDYKNGILKFHKDFAGASFLICYKVDNDWALQAYKSYDVYTRHHTLITGTGQLGYREYYLDSRDEYRGLVYLNRCYAGSSVAVDYSYRTNDPGSPVVPVSGEIFQVPDETGTFGVCSVDILSKVATSLGRSSDEISIVDVSRVYGVSLGARVIWRNGAAGSVTGRWKKVNLQTYLTEERY